MRITAEQKANTRERILAAASELFRSKGFAATTTRDIAQAAKIASGTLFNYFPSKEALVAALVEAAVEPLGRAALPLDAPSLEEALFARVAAELRRLKPHRAYLSVLFETAGSPLAQARPDDTHARLRIGHLEQVAALVRHYQNRELSPVALQLYWTMYTGVLGYWAADKSPRQEDTLALLDQSLAMFTGWLPSQPEA